MKGRNSGREKEQKDGKMVERKRTNERKKVGKHLLTRSFFHIVLAFKQSLARSVHLLSQRFQAFLF
jgi:hypothetical protein